MNAPLVRSQVLTSKRQSLRVYIKTEQLPIWRASLQDPASVTARAQSAIHITTAAFGLQCVYNLLVKYRFMLHRVCPQEQVFAKHPVGVPALYGQE